MRKNRLLVSALCVSMVLTQLPLNVFAASKDPDAINNSYDLIYDELSETGIDETVSDEVIMDLDGDQDPTTDPAAGPATDPTTDPATDPATDPVTDPTTDPEPVSPEPVPSPAPGYAVTEIPEQAQFDLISVEPASYAAQFTYSYNFSIGKSHIKMGYNYTKLYLLYSDDPSVLESEEIYAERPSSTTASTGAYIGRLTRLSSSYDKSTRTYTYTVQACGNDIKPFVPGQKYYWMLVSAANYKAPKIKGSTNRNTIKFNPITDGYYDFTMTEGIEQTQVSVKDIKVDEVGVAATNITFTVDNPLNESLIQNRVYYDAAGGYTSYSPAYRTAPDSNIYRATIYPGKKTVSVYAQAITRDGLTESAIKSHEFKTGTVSVTPKTLNPDDVSFKLKTYADSDENFVGGTFVINSAYQIDDSEFTLTIKDPNKKPDDPEDDYVQFGDYYFTAETSADSPTGLCMVSNENEPLSIGSKTTATVKLALTVYSDLSKETNDDVIYDTDTILWTKSVAVKVVDQVPVTGIYLPDDEEINIPAGSAVTISPEFEPRNATDKSLKWESSNPDIAYVTESGVIVGKNEGDATIRAYAQDESGVVSNEIIVHVTGSLFDDDEEEIDEVLEQDADDPNRDEGLWITTIDDTNIFYTGQAITPPVRVYDGNRMLKEKTDYTLSYSNNKAVYEITREEGDEDSDEDGDDTDSAYHIGHAVYAVDLSVPTVYAKLKGNYAGTLTSTFSIHKSDKTAQSLKDATITLNPGYPYNGAPVEPEPVVKLGNETLTEGTDYIVTYSNNEKIGKAKLAVIGLGFYYGTKTAQFAITGREFSGSTIHVNNDEPITAIYTASGAKPALKVTYGAGDDAEVLKEGVDYTVKYTNNKAVTGANTKKMPAVTLTGKGFYKGKFIKNYTILQKDFSVVTILATDKPEPAKAGKYTTTIKVTDIDGTVLKPGKDYDKNIRYIEWDPESETKGQLLDKNSKPKAGDTIRLEIKGKGNYTDSVAVGYFRILSANMDIAKAKVAIKDQMFAGKGVAVKIPEKDSQFNVEMGGKRIGLATAKYPDGFEIVPGSYMNNTKLGKAKVTIHGTGIYGGYKTVIFNIVARSNDSSGFGFPGFDGPIKVTRPTYVKGELICLAETEDEANSIALAYDITVKDFSYGVAVFDCGDKDIFELIEFGKAHGLKELSVNHIYYLDKTYSTYETEAERKQSKN